MIACKYCSNEVKYQDHCETHWMLGTLFQYEMSHMWSLKDSYEEFMQKFENWMVELSVEDINDIRKNYWEKV